MVKKLDKCIETERLLLLPLGIRFLDSTHAYASDIENTKMMIYLPHVTKQETIDFLNQTDQQWEMDYPDSYEYAILLEDKHIGAVSLSDAFGAGYRKSIGSI